MTSTARMLMAKLLSRGPVLEKPRSPRSTDS
jgi:hypothetical protein